MNSLFIYRRIYYMEIFYSIKRIFFMLNEQWKNNLFSLSLLIVSIARKAVHTSYGDK